MTIDFGQYELFIFDLDDTLINTTQAIRHGKDVLLSNLSTQLNKTTEEVEDLLELCVKLFGSSNVQDVVQAVLLELGYDFDHSIRSAKRLEEKFYNVYWSTLRAFPNTLNMLERLRLREKKLAMATNGSWELQIKKINTTGLNRYFDQSNIQCSEKAGFFLKKPSPYMLNLIKRKYSIPRSQIAFFGNAAVDILSAKLAGITVIAVNPIENPNQLSIHQPDELIADWNSLLNMT